MKSIDEKYLPIIKACMNEINCEICRLFWNENQMEYDTPFENTGNKYDNDTFSVRAYYWGDDDSLIRLPNFKYKDLEVRWYKHYRRCLIAQKDSDISLDFLADMVNDCILSLRRDFGEEDE